MYPDFFIVGAPKAGTTSIWYYLSQHPDVYMSNPKEPNYFSREYIENEGLYYKRSTIDTEEKYQKLFEERKDKRITGEASVSYLFYPSVPRRIAEVAPKAKILIFLRKPSERAFSHYLMDVKLGFIDGTFESIVHKKNTSSIHHLYYQQVVELGFYFPQVKRYFDCFPEDNIKVVLYDDLTMFPQQVIKEIFSFLTVDSDFSVDIALKKNVYAVSHFSVVNKLYVIESLRAIMKRLLPASLVRSVKMKLFTKAEKPEFSSSTNAYLQRLYRDDIVQLEHLINKDLSHWYS